MFHFHHDYVAKRSILWSRREETHKSPLSVLTCWCIYNWNHIYMVVLTFWCFFFVFLECYNVSVTAYLLVNLTPGSKYNISLAAVTGAGEGPQVFHIINTPPENMTGNNLKLVWSVSVNTQDLNTSFPPPQISLFCPSSAAVHPEYAVCDVFNLNIVHLHVEAVSDKIWQSPLCTFIMHFSSFSSDHVSRIKQKVFPPVPRPVISDFTYYQAPSQVREKHLRLLPVLVSMSLLATAVWWEETKNRLNS